MTSTRRSLLILGGSRWQLGIIRRASELGLRTVVGDISPAAPGRELADVFVEVDTNDVDALVEAARTHGVAFAVAEQTDRTVPIAAAVNERLGLPGIGSETARRFTNKFAMRQALEGSGVAMPRYAEVAGVDEAKAKAAEWGYPVVLKPKASQSSFGVFKVSSDAEADAVVAQTLHLSTDGRFLVEEFVQGTEMTVEGISLDGKCTILAVSEKEHYPYNDCVARRLAYPPRFDDALMQRIRETAARVVEWLGLQNGISHAEYRVRGDVPYLVEVAARGGGTRIASHIAPHVSGVDMYEVLLRKLLGEEVVLPPLQHRAALLEFLDFAPGKVKEIAGCNELLESGTVFEIDLAFRAGDTIVRPTDDKTRLGYFIVLADSRDELDRRSELVRSTVKVVYE